MRSVVQESQLTFQIAMLAYLNCLSTGTCVGTENRMWGLPWCQNKETQSRHSNDIQCLLITSGNHDDSESHS
jgi:hypothetical protein